MAQQTGVDSSTTATHAGPSTANYIAGQSYAYPPLPAPATTPHRYQLPVPPHAPSALFSAAAVASSHLQQQQQQQQQAISYALPTQVPYAIAPHEATTADPDAVKRARMAQHTRDLEEWMMAAAASNGAQHQTGGSTETTTRERGTKSALEAAIEAVEGSDLDAEGEDDVDYETLLPPPPPAKRARTSASSSAASKNAAVPRPRARQAASGSSSGGGPGSNRTSDGAARSNGSGSGGGGSGGGGVPSIAPATTNSSAGPPRKGKAGAIARKYLMETDVVPTSATSTEDFSLPMLPPLPAGAKVYTPATDPLIEAHMAANGNGATKANEAQQTGAPSPAPAPVTGKGKRKAPTARRYSANGTSGGASTGTALVTSIHADGPEEPIVGPDPTPDLLVLLYPIQPRPARPPRARAHSGSPMSTAAAAGAAAAAAAGAKGPLLSAEQKKANHIASEQKRRAAIRKGYDGLCEVVPTLKAAVEEFEERVRKVAVATPGDKAAEEAAAAIEQAKLAAAIEKGKRQGRGKGGESTTGALMGGISVGGEKIDGRAGPKSEAVVLTQTVEHIRRLLSDRTALLTKLTQIHASGRAHGPTGASREWDDRWDDGMREEMGIALVDDADLED